MPKRTDRLCGGNALDGSGRRKGVSGNCYGPVRIFVNTELVFRSAVREDVNVRMEKTFRVSLKKGWNTFLFRFIQTASGFGCLFTPVEIRWNPLTFTGPFQERRDTLDLRIRNPAGMRMMICRRPGGCRGRKPKRGFAGTRSGNEERRAESAAFGADFPETLRKICACLDFFCTEKKRRWQDSDHRPYGQRPRLWLDGKQIIRSEGKREKLYPKQRRAPGSISFSWRFAAWKRSAFCGCFSHGRGREDFV